MVKLGVFSLWNGQQAFHSRPARSSLTVGAITALSTVRARSSSSHAVERGKTRPYARIAMSQEAAEKLSTEGRRKLIPKDSYRCVKPAIMVNLDGFRNDPPQERERSHKGGGFNAEENRRACPRSRYRPRNRGRIRRAYHDEPAACSRRPRPDRLSRDARGSPRAHKR